MDKLLKSNITTNILLIAIFTVLCYGVSLFTEVKSDIEYIRAYTSDIPDIETVTNNIETKIHYRR